MSPISDALARLWPRTRASSRDEKASRTAPLIAIETLGRPVWTPRDYAAFAREGYMQNAIVYRSVRMIAEAAASIPLLLYERDEELAAHPLLDLLRRPSAHQTGTDFFEAWYGFLLVAGNAYAEAVAAGGRLRELHVLRPDRMKVVPGIDGWPEAYEYTAGGATVRFGAEPVPAVRPILHVRLFHPANDHYGMSPIEAAAAAIDLHNTAARWNKALLDNSARPSGALVYAAAEGRMTAEQFARLKTELEQGFQGAKQAGRPLLLEGGLDWKPLGLSPKDMDFVDARHGAAREIALALGVPPMLLGIPGDNTYSNYQEATRSFWRQTVLPLVCRTAKAVAAWLAPGFGGGLELKPDLDQVEALSAEREALWARLERASFLTLNEKRAAVGYGPVEGGDAERALPTESGSLLVLRKYRPDQARAPRGTPEGGQWVDEGGGGGVSGGDRSRSDALTDAGHDDSGTRESDRVRVAQAEEPSGYRVDLHEHRQRGGHTIEEHVGKTDAYMLASVRGDRGFFYARKRHGSFPSVEAATKLVSSTLARNCEIVDRVARGELDDAFITAEFGSRTGREAFRPAENSEPYLRDTNGVGVFLVHDPEESSGFTIISAYPRNPE